jgi:hypothetical protein
MDPIHPIAPGPPAIAGTGRVPVERVERIARERERRAKEEQERRRRDESNSAETQTGDGDNDERPHIDIRV